MVLRELPAVDTAEIDETTRKIKVQLARPMDLAEIAAHLHARDLHLRLLAEREPTLEEVFMKLTKGLVS